MVAGPVIPANERFRGLRAFVEDQARVVHRVKTEHPQLIPAGMEFPFSYLCVPWLIDPGTEPQRQEMARLREEFEREGFTGDQVRATLQAILSNDQHLRECCPTTAHLAHALDWGIISPLMILVEANAPGERLDHKFEEFSTATYEMRFKAIALSHLFNFAAEQVSLRFETVRVERLDGPTISRILGEISLQSFLHPPSCGDYFVVAEREGACNDFVTFLAHERNNATNFARVLQYFKDGVVHVDYSVPYFLPHWVNHIRKFGIFFLGSPRRTPYEGGARQYRVTAAAVPEISRWLRGYSLPDIERRLADERNQLRQTTLRAGDYFEGSHEDEDNVDRLVSLAISLEALLSPTDKTELSFRIAQFTAQLIGTTSAERTEIFDAVKEFYTRRSSLMHGQYNVDDYQAGRFVTAVECERWASIVRRSILRFFTLHIRGTNQRQDILKRLVNAALDNAEAERLRQESDIGVLLDERLPR